RLAHEAESEKEDAKSVGSVERGAWSVCTGFRLQTLDFRLSKRRVCPNRQEPKECAEDVFSLGDPGDRFHVQRMPGEEPRDTGAAPLRASQPPQYEKEEQSVGDVQQHAGEVMARRMQVKELAIGHVRKPGQRMP